MKRNARTGMTLAALLVAALVSAAALAGCRPAPPAERGPSPSATDPAPADPAPAARPEADPAAAPEPADPPPPARITIAAVGDIMMHMPVVNAAKTPDGYDFSPMFAEVAPYIGAADLAIANLETTLAEGQRPFSGFPRFNSPTAVAVAAREAGFDVLTTANNHAMDSGARGIQVTLGRLDDLGLMHTGSFRSAGERAAGGLELDIRGIRVGILAYSYSTNGIPMPEPWMVNLLDPELILADMDRLRPRVDLLILVLHWGEEYTNVPTAEQVALADRLIAAGADVIIGSHPHVLQRAELRTVPGPGGSRQALVAYSMGNFISNQGSLRKMTGTILFIQVEKGRGVTGVRYLPTWVHLTWRAGRAMYRVLPVPDALAAADPLLSPADRETLGAALEHAGKQLRGTPGVELLQPVP